jgi:hypothetical protein
MSNRLDSKPQIWTLASDLGLQLSRSPSYDILDFVRQRIRRILRKFRCADLKALLNAAADDVGTIFEEVRSDDDLMRLQEKYVLLGEQAFANLEKELSGNDDYAITIRRVKAHAWERPFVSVIDCRGEKIFRRYFSMWHELAHLLTLTPQMRLVFRRTHAAPALADPEERLMDVIASEVGFLPDFLSGSGDVSFASIQKIREECCPEASAQAATIGIVKAIPRPCILLEARMALRKGEVAAAEQLGLGLGETNPLPVLRAIHVTVNAAAREAGIRMFPHWRVPEQSVISRVFKNGGHGESEEDMSWWATSVGARLDSCPVTVQARKCWDSVQALLVPKV